MSTAQALSAFAADAPRYGSEPVNSYYQLNQTGQAQNVQSVNGLGGQVVIQLNGTPIPATGQDINIVAGTGVLSVVAGGQSATGNVGLTSTDGSIVLTNPGGANAAVNLQSVVPSSRITYIPNNVTGTSTYLIIGGLGVATTPRIPVFTATGLTAGKLYLMTVDVTFGVYPGWTPTGVTEAILAFSYTTTGGFTQPLIAPSGSASAYPIVETFAAFASAESAGQFNATRQSFTSIIVASGTSLEIAARPSGQTSGPLLTVQNGSYMQLTQLN